MKNKEAEDEVRVRGLAASWIWCWLEKWLTSTKSFCPTIILTGKHIKLVAIWMM